MINSDELFSIFDDNHNNNKVKIQKQQKSPSWDNIDSFIKVLKNKNVYLNTILHLYKLQNNSSSGIDKVLEESHHILYDIAFSHLTHINTNIDAIKNDLKDFPNQEELIDTLTNILYFFEKKEEYEKCAYIKKFLDFLKV